MHFKYWIFVILALSVVFSGYIYYKSIDVEDISETNNPDAGKLTLKGVTFLTELSPALEAAKAQGKPVFVYARSETCGWCKKFEAETFTNQSVIKTLNENYILFSIDVDKQKSETRNFRVVGTPTEIFLGPNGTEIKRIRGYVDNETFLNIINELAN
ncbi:MAG: thioredoxin fold domain-containing protein [Candidatus Methanoperedens sp.]